MGINRSDWNEAMMEQQKRGMEGRMTPAEQYRIKKEELDRQIAGPEDYCSCPEKCPHHGKCRECVLIHRGHRDHLPYCFFDMINERLYAVQRLTEGSLAEYAREKDASWTYEDNCSMCGAPADVQDKLDRINAKYKD